jgi:hypothetical protein
VAVAIAGGALGPEVARPLPAELQHADAVRAQLGQIALEHDAVLRDGDGAERAQLRIELRFVACDRLARAADAARQLDAHMTAPQQAAARRPRIVDRERREAGQHDVAHAFGERWLPACRRGCI